MTHNNNTIQGRFLGVLPYDFRIPTVPKILRRVYQPGGPMLVPKVFGAGWTLNLAHRGTWLLMAGTAAFATIAALVG